MNVLILDDKFERLYLLQILIWNSTALANYTTVILHMHRAGSIFLAKQMSECESWTKKQITKLQVYVAKRRWEIWSVPMRSDWVPIAPWRLAGFT